MATPAPETPPVGGLFGAGQVPFDCNMKRLIIIDGNAIIHRAYHALPPMTTKTGQMVNAVYGFTSMLLKVWHDLKPEYIAVTFDMAGPTFRHKQFDKYKATRVKADQELYDQIPPVHDLVRAFNIPIYEKRGYEADDVIGTITRKIKKNKDLEILIVTGDKDTLQLVDDNVKVFTLRKGMSDTIIYDKAELKKIFGLTPEQTIDFKALRGDASDNIPGVPGVGEKTAIELIEKFGSLEEIYKTVNSKQKTAKSDIKPNVLKKLIDGEASAKMSYELATINQNVPEIDFELDNCLAKDFDREKVIKLFQDLEFVSLAKRLPGEEQSKKTKNNSEVRTSRTDKFDFIEITKKDELSKITDLIKISGGFACQAVFDGDDVFIGNFSGLIIVAGGRGFYLKGILDKEWFADEKIELVGHDLKKLVKILFVHRQIEIKNNLFDLMLASYVLNPGSRAHDLSSIALKFLGKEMKSVGGQESLFGFDARESAHELHLLSLTKNKLQAELEKVNNYDLLKEIETPLLKILAKMELNGIAVDLNRLKELSNDLEIEVKKITKRIYSMAGMEFNISSPVQLRQVLFEEMDIPIEGIKKGKTGLSTAAAELEKMRGLHPIIEEIVNYRELTKLQNTYVDVLPKLINKKTGRVHTTFNQAVTATGRLSSSDPNLQNIPIRTELGREIRKTFVAEKKNVLLSADYSQIELRIVASLAEDKKMIEIFKRDEDIHKATAAAINGVSLDKVTKEMRNAAKQVNFGVLYGMGSYGLSWRTDLTPAAAKKFIDKYFTEFSGVKKYIENIIALTKKEGYCETLFGRRRYLPEIHASNFQIRSAAERMAINHPVQGTAADLIKMAMIDIDKKIKANADKFGKGKVRMLLQVHDELLFEVQKGLEDDLGKIVKEVMESAVVLRVPIKVEINKGKSWGEIK